MCGKTRLVDVATVLFGLSATWLLAGCFSSPSGESSSNGSSRASVEIEHPEGDPSVPAEQGGPGFAGEGWKTAEPGPIGDPRAVKGGAIQSYIRAWPDNLRMYGIRSNTWFNYLVRDLCYESLLRIHPDTLEFIPGLASHWKVSDDQMTFTFRIDPRAHWSDGEPVTTDDVLATYKLLMDDTLLAPTYKEMLSKLEEPVARSKYIVEVKCKEKDWRNFINTSGLLILPAHDIGGLSGKEYLDDYNFSYTACSGPYIIYPEDIKTDQSITLTRRKDYWAIDDESNEGMFNFDRIRFQVIREERLAFDKAVKGELDFYNVNTAKWWVEDLANTAAVEKGHLVRRKVYTKFPKGFQGQALNMRHPLLQDVRVRKALAHLYDRRTMLEKFAYNEYEPLKSYFPASDGENPANQLVEYDPQKAVALLAEAGWTERGPDGILRKGNQRLSMKLTYSSQFFEKYLTNLQESCKQVGVEIELILLDPETRWNNVQDRNFEIVGMNWGTILFPNPRGMWHSEMSEKKGSNNIAGFQSETVDQLIDQYDKEFDLQKRNELLRQMDAEIFSQHPYVLDWYLPAQRFVYWNKFGMPEGVLHKYDEWEDAFSTWWFDESKAQTLRSARENDTALPIPPMEVRPWDDQSQTAAVD